MRRLHLLDKHHYPKYFPFDLVYTGTLTFEQKKIRDKKNKERISRKNKEKIHDQVNDTDMMDTLTDSMSKLKIPKTISFGHRPPALPQYRQHKKTATIPSSDNTNTIKDIEMIESKPKHRRKRGPKKKKQPQLQSMIE